MKNILLKFAGLVFTLLLCSYGFAQKKTFTREYFYQASERDSKVTAREAAMQQMQVLLLKEIGQVIQSEEALRKLSVIKDGKETFSENFSQEVMAITAGFVEMKILNETWNGKTYYIEAKMTVDPKEVSQRVAKILDDKQKEKEREAAQQGEERAKAERARAEAEKKAKEEREKQAWERIEAQRKEMAREKTLAKQKAKAGVLYQPSVCELDFGAMYLPSKKSDYTFLNAGIRCTKNISPNVGFDIFKLSLVAKGYSRSSTYSYYDYERGEGADGDFDDYYGAEPYVQLLTGIRFATNRFGKSKNTYFYTALRAGVGVGSFDYKYGSSYDDPFYNYSWSNYIAFATELDVGIHFKYFFLGATVNHNFFFNSEYVYSPEFGNVNKIMRRPDWGLRFGWDIEWRKPY